MKKWIFGLLLAFASTLVLPSCSKKSGCPATESLKPKTNRKGEFSRSKSKSGLWDKKQRKRMSS